MASCQLMIRKVGMHEGHQGLVSLSLEGHGHCRLFSEGLRRYPRVLNPSRSLDHHEPAIMGRPLERPEKEPVDFRIQPSIEYLSQGSRDRSFKLKFKGLLRVLHYLFSFFFLSLKYCSN